MRRVLEFAMPIPVPIGAPRGITAAAPTSIKRSCKHNVIRGIGQNSEAFLHQNSGRFHGGLDVWVEGGQVAYDFDFDPVGEAYLTAPGGRRG